MGRKDGENAVPTTIGTAKPSANVHPIAMASTGVERVRSNTVATIAPATAYVNATASTDTFDHVAKLGRERGRESPTPVPPAMAILAGRSATSTKLCTEISWAAVAKAAPKIPYWTRRTPPAPAIALTTTNKEAAQTAVTPTERATTPRAQV